MSDDTIRRTFQRDRTFAKFESNSKRWSAIGYSSNDVSISNTDNTMHSDFKTNMAISTTNLPEYSEETEYNENYPEKLQPQFKTSRNRFASTPLLLQDTIHDDQESPVTPEPALLGVKQKLILFEKLNSNEYITIIPPKLKPKPKNYERKFITQWHLGHHRQTMAEALTNESKVENSISSSKQIVADEVGITESSEYKTKEIKSNIAYIAPYNSEPTLESEASQNGYTDEEKDPTNPETQNRQIKGSELISNSNETKTKSKEIHGIADVVEAVLENKSWIKSSDKSIVREHSSFSIEKRDRSNLDLRFNEAMSTTNKSFLSPEFMKFVGLHNEDSKEDERNLIDNEEVVISNSKSDVILSSPLEEDHNDADVEDNTQDTWNAKETVVDVNNCLQHYSSNKEDILNVKSKPSNYKIFEDLEALLKPKNEDITSEKNIKMLNTNDLEGVMLKPKSKELSRNYKSLTAQQALKLRGEKYTSLRPHKSGLEDIDHRQMYAKGQESIQPILDELIKTEETYVESLWLGLNNYGQLFERKDVPRSLKGKKYVLFCNIEQIAEFHRDEFLPMLMRNRYDLKQLFDEFQGFIDQNCFYAYVLYAMNNQRSLELCETFKKYFKILQLERNDTLGINSFLLQPIQRVARYPLLLKEFIKKLFDNYPLKPVLDSCCRLDKKLQNLLNAINKSEVINDLACLSETHEFNIFYQGKFRNVAEFNVHDHRLKRSYRSKVFAYDKCIIYTEIKRKQVVFRGRYPREHLGISIQAKYFTLFYNRRKQQECDFMGDPSIVKQWQELIVDIISSYAEEERMRLKQLHLKENGEMSQMRIKPAVSLLLFRDTNRFSTDSGDISYV